MKLINYKFLLLLYFVVFTISTTSVLAQQKQITIQLDNTDKQILFAIDEIKKTANGKGYEVVIAKKNQTKTTSSIVVKIISDAETARAICKEKGLKEPVHMDWQCYTIRTRTLPDQQLVYVLAGDKTGAMYGGLDIAEAIRIGTLMDITESDNKPYLERRGIKFNIPLDLRTPSYTDVSDAGQQNIPVVWELDFWKQQFDEMARSRYNTISIWSLNPFPSLVKVPEYPDVALNDVWRTTVKLDDKFGGSGADFLNENMLKNYEIVKKMTIDQKITFWRTVMEYARDRGIEVYFFTWNIFMHGEQGKYGITTNRSNETTIAYMRASVRELVLTYPLLAGIGITAGENMGKNMETYTNEEWLWNTYGQGVADAIAKQPGRKIRLIHRFHMTGLSDINNSFKDFPGTIDLSIKYSIAHMHSITNPPFSLGAFEIMPQNQKTWLTVRNDDIYSFRWGNPNYAREYIKNIPHIERVAGFYMGPDGYCWGRDFLGKDGLTERPLIIQKSWYSFMLWGRLSYNPQLTDELFQQTLKARFPDVSSTNLIKAWSAASMVFPWTTRLCWGDIDVKWLPEACWSNPRFKGFYTVKDFIEVEPVAGSNIRNITQWAQNYHTNKPDSLHSPLAVADSISKYSRIALTYLHKLPEYNPTASNELEQTLGDIEAFATIGFYYQEKIKAACSLALYNFYGLQEDKIDAVDHLTKAKKYWQSYASLYNSKYKSALYNRVGFVDIPALVEKTEEDIEMAKNWKVGDIKEYVPKGKTEVPFGK